ncbi:endoplasmic reticulum-golgi intermediate compartment protein [Anaeramoeba flamelloides]|uniref:Endoplasmic reticulum-golgi intermediate compartment protein n=1 Tax=Anaeramoeba flamelloides TaxID=1746091 RepID=A0ABQ8XZE3_9EUKA|nr:endoplasmic reticulum-golgi intermediate compartment protein [Anaeramoeba flamelloides]
MAKLLSRRIKNKVELGSNDLKDNEDEAEKDKEKENKLPDNYCGDCYGAPSTKPVGVVTRAKTSKRHTKQKLELGKLIGKFEQCIREGITSIRQFQQQTNEDPVIESQKRRCRVNGYLSVNKVRGNFHIAPGKASQQRRSHLHRLSNSIDKKQLNL